MMMKTTLKVDGLLDPVPGPSFGSSMLMPSFALNFFWFLPDNFQLRSVVPLPSPP
jgi:hypothetical protein